MILYEVKGMRTNDSWYCKEGDTYHAFFLMRREGEYPQSIGHVFSKDLLHWEYAGVVLAPEMDGWNDLTTATGSVVKYDGKWYMLYSGLAKAPERGGLGLAVSDDLFTWKRVGDGPVIGLRKLGDFVFGTPGDPDVRTQYGKGYPFEWEGKTVYCNPLGDPYIYPEPVDGEYYIFVNSHAVDYPINGRGATAIFKTKDFTSFVPYKIAVLDSCDRMETVQVWKHENTYYMYVGRIQSRTDEKGQINGQDNQNWLFSSSCFTGPYHPVQQLHFKPERAECFPYIAKVLKDPNGRDVMLVNNNPVGAGGPYPVHYLPDGTIELDYDV